VRVEGQLTFNGTAQLLNGALAGCGLAYVPEGLGSSTSKKAVSSGCLRIGARPIPAITFSIQAAANPPRPLRWWLMRCAIAPQRT